MSKFAEQQLKKAFSAGHSFSKKDLWELFQKLEPDLNENTFRSRIYHLRQKNILQQLDKSTYTLGVKRTFKPVLDDELIHLDKFITNSIGSEPYCIWNSSWLNQFSRHQIMRNFYIVETGKDVMQTLFFYLKDVWRREVFLNPTQEILELYAREADMPVILRPLISRSPLQAEIPHDKIVSVPTLEKVLVDTYTDDVLFNYVQGSELETIVEQALDKYSVNATTLLAYARRRNKEAEWKGYLESHSFYS